MLLPHNCSDKADVEQFYSYLQIATGQISARNFLDVHGDFNARHGPEYASYAYNTDVSNRNGQHLVSFLQENSLLAANTMFQKRQGKFWTNQNWRNSATNAEAYSTIKTVNFDHRVVSMRVRLSLRQPKHTGPK